MELYNISANFLGDSITEGAVATSNEKIYHQILAKKYDMKVARNYGIGGSRIARQLPNSDGSIDNDMSFSKRFYDMDDDAELVVVFGGTNDYGHGNAPIGISKDRTPETFWGACHYVMSGLINKYPHSRIVVMTPLHRINEDDPKGENGKKPYNVAPLSEYVSIIRQVAEYYSMPIIDLWANSGLQPSVEVIKKEYCPDGLHPNDAGHQRLADYIGACLENL